ncbi:hypothetical protein GCM10009689_16770 [Brevibacterium antiquum]|uniref:hypothetical protein n=1 Tax=Brevibacterium antiquum TaxID=234835 RepID=UPI0018DF2A3F|nr:hypothetical protein [Brevibacterium antiquum]
MHFKSISTLAVIGLLSMSGCADSANNRAAEKATSEAESTQAQSPAPTGEAGGNSDSSEAERTEVPTESASDSKPSDAAKGSKVTLSTDSEKVAIEPTDVYCSGEPGSIRHIIGKTNNEVPLIKVEKTEFVMVKTGHGRPYKSKGPNGIHYGENSVSFDGTEVGSAVLSGSMTCTKWQD